MKILKFHIVGLTHNDVKNCEVQYAKEAVGKTLCLVPDDANPFDLLAVKAYEGQKSIGFCLGTRSRGCKSCHHRIGR